MSGSVNLLLGTGGTATWTPASLGSALIAWYKADAGVYKDAGSTLAGNNETVQQWNDQSGNSYHLSQGTLVSRATYKTNTLNALPIISADNTLFDQYLATTGQPVTLGGTLLSAFMVRKVTAASAAGRVLTISTPGSGDLGADVCIIEYDPSITTPKSYNAGDKSNGTVSSGTWNQLGSIWDGTNNTMYIGNVAQTGVANTPTFASAVDISLFSDGSADNVSGQIAEIIFTNTALSAGDRNSLATYFTNKWAV